MIDYSKFTTQELLEVRESIDEQSPNYPLLISEIEKRQNEIDDIQEDNELKQYDLDKLKVKTVGAFQLASALILTLIILYSIVAGDGVDDLTISIALPLIVLNAVAGFTAFNQVSKWYWLSIANQSLQLFSFSIGSLYANYAGIGFVNVILTWGQEFSLRFSAELAPGFAFYKYTEVQQVQFIAIDALAIFFILAFIRIKDFEARA